VQRWEKQAGLPVHRHAESRLRTAYAYRSELEAWWRTQRTSEEESTGRRSRMSARTIITASVVLLLIAAAGAGVFFTRTKPPEAAPPAPAKITVLLTSVETQLDDPTVAAVIADAIGRELGGRGPLETAAPARITRMLRLMRRDPAAPLTIPIARELAIRDGGIRFVIAAAVQRSPSGFVVNLHAVDPLDGRVRVSVERLAAGRHALAAQAAEGATQLSHDLGDAGIPPAAIEPLEPVTTASLNALRFYSSAVQAGRRRQWGASELLARQAVGADPEFASAYSWIGWAMRQQGRTISECLPLLDRAVVLATATTEREIYLIGGTRHLVAGDVASAIAAYEALLRLQPRDRHTLDRLVEAYARTGRMREAVEASVKRSEYEPADFYANVRAAHALVVWQGDRRRAARFVELAQQQVSPAAIADWPRWVAWLSALPVFDAWLDGNNQAAFDALASLERGLDRRLGRERDAFATIIGCSYLAFGKLRQARTAFHHAGAPTRQLDLAMLALASGNERAARDWLLQIPGQSSLEPALFARVGLITEAERGLERMPPSEHAEGIVNVTRGLIAMRQSNGDAAMTSLRQGVDLLRFSGEPDYFLGVEALAHLWLLHGDVDRAADWLRDASEQQTRTYGAAQWNAGAWIGINGDLLRVCWRHGRVDQARQVRALLLQTLRDADPAHLVARAARTADR
jgi:tetratricopeptide (TPR) repeat protein